MHEVGLVAELVDAAVERSGGRPVAAIRVRRATTVPEDVLRQAFEMLVPGTPLESATLEVEPFDVRLVCPCGFDGALGHDDVIGPSQAVCPGFSELRGIPPMPELELLEVRPREMA
jgi:Zn finger protein HypA/HybF involved in hydrogenase expression